MISRFTDRQRPISGPRRAVRLLSVLQGLKDTANSARKGDKENSPCQLSISRIWNSGSESILLHPLFTLYFPSFITGNWSNLVRIRNNRSKGIDRQMKPRVNYPWNICENFSIKFRHVEWDVCIVWIVFFFGFDGRRIYIWEVFWKEFLYFYIEM